ncbi:MAG TPA: acyltransferase family protein, partial [Candidatus Acidoferrum sp.]|nr:acyltransferase family protein [Candidatus Acidoferrum sp.]
MLQQNRLHALDAVRAFALLMGLVLHGAFSFIPGMFPGVWAFVDNSPSTTLSVVVFATHIFRMALFFFIAGLFARMMWMRKGADGFWLDRALRILLPLAVLWPVLDAWVGTVWKWGVSVYFNGNVPAFPGAGAGAPRPFGAMSWDHLWFLYVLCVLYVGMLTVRSLVTAFDKRDVVGTALETWLVWLVRSGAAAVLLGLPLFAALLGNKTWIAFFGIPTPDNSFFTNQYALIGFGTAFGIG